MYVCVNFYMRIAAILLLLCIVFDIARRWHSFVVLVVVSALLLATISYDLFCFASTTLTNKNISIYDAKNAWNYSTRGSGGV